MRVSMCEFEMRRAWDHLARAHRHLNNATNSMSGSRRKGIVLMKAVVRLAVERIIMLIHPQLTQKQWSRMVRDTLRH